MAWTKLDFSPKHRGKTLPQIILTDPDWFFWSVVNDVWVNKPYQLQKESKIIGLKATCIRIPNNEENNLVVQYNLHTDLTPIGFEIIDENQPYYEGGRSIRGGNVIDLYYSYGSKKYDKLGGRLMIKSLKYWVFGDENIKLTKAKCEAFFDDDSNFVLK